MATVYSNVAQNQSDAASKLTGMADRAEGQAMGGLVQVAYATYTVTAALAAADVINIVKLPAGARILPQLCRVQTDGVGATTCTINIGPASDADLYATAINVNAATTTQGGIAWDEEVAGELLTDIASPEEWVTATVAALTGTATAGRLVSFLIAYTVSR